MEIGEYLGRYVGKENGDAIGDLLTEHIKRAAGVVTALKNNGNIRSALRLLFKNVENVAEALSKISQNSLLYDKVYEEFKKHNEFVVELAKLHFNGKYQNEITTYDMYYTHMLSFSDMLCDGLIH